MADIRMRAAIFDVDGTLLDSMGIWEDVGARYLRGLGIRPKDGLGDILFSMSLEEGAAYLIETYQLLLTGPEVIEGVLDIVRSFYYNEAGLKEGARELLDELYGRKIPMAIATSSDREHVERAFERLGIQRYFKEMLTCSEVMAGKRNSPLIYQRAAELLGAVPEDTWVFEDALHAVQTAKGADFRVAAVFDEYSKQDRAELERTADIYLENLKEYRHKLRLYAG